MRRSADTRPLRLLLPVALAAAACQGGAHGRHQEEKRAEAEVTTPVEVVRAVRGPVSDGIEGTATVEARVRATLRARVAGTIRQLEVEEGAPVTTRRPLAVVDRPELQSVLAQARANLEKAKRERETADQLRAQGLVPAQQAEEAAFAERQARLELDRLRDEQGLERITSPIEGVVIARHVHAGEAVTPGTPIFEVADLSGLEANLHVPERHLARLQVELPVELFAAGLGGAAVTGKVARIAPVVDPQSGTVKVTVDLGDGDGGRLRPGMYVRARVVLDTRPEAVLIPRRAVVHEDDRAFAFRVREGVAERLPLELGYGDRDRVEVRGGVEEGDALVVFGHRGLQDGARVRVIEPPPASTPVQAGGTSL